METEQTVRTLAHELTAGGRIRRQVWGPRAAWQVRVRWWIPPIIVAAVLLAGPAGLALPAGPLLAVAAVMLLYNALFAAAFARDPDGTDRDRERRLNMLQVVLDYAAVFVLIHYTGALDSPLLHFLSLHVIFAAVLFRRALAYTFAAVAIIGLALHTLGENAGLWISYPITGLTRVSSGVSTPAHQLAILLCFAAVVLFSAGLVTWIMRRLRDRVLGLADATDRVAELNEKLASLNAIARTIGLQRQMTPALDRAVHELRVVTGVPAAAIKLLSPDGRQLRYAAVSGLPRQAIADRKLTVAASRPNRRILEGEPRVIFRLDRYEDEPLQYGDALRAAGIKAVLMLPLRVEQNTFGVLSLYASDPHQFDDPDTDFLQLAADLVALAVENARAYEATEKLMLERTRIMLQVTHNLRAPVNASISILDALRGGYIGDVAPEQRAYLERIHSRLTQLSNTVGELLTIAQTRVQGGDFEPVAIDPLTLAADVERTFRDSARAKEIDLRIETPDALPALNGDPDQLQQLLENLVSNAIKYTLRGGKVVVAFERAAADRIRLSVRDTGIGIPAAEQAKLFTEFFRASNARKLEEVGTGLGLSIVKQTVEQHGGTLNVTSQEGQGTTFTVELPLASPGAAPAADLSPQAKTSRRAR